MHQTFVVFLKPAGGWEAGKDKHHQVGWDDHSDYIRRLLHSGKMLIDGFFKDDGSRMQVYVATSADEVREWLNNDPWVANGVFEVTALREWEFNLNTWRK